MKNTVIIKGNRYGITIVLDKDAKLSDLKSELEIRLEKAESFFDSNKQLAVSFEGRNLSNEEMDQLLTVIKEHSKLNIQYVLDSDNDTEARFRDALQKLQEKESQGSKSVEDREQKVDSAGGDQGREQTNASKETADSVTLQISESVDPEDSNMLTPENPDPINSETMEKKECSDHNGLFYKGTLRSGQTLETKESLVIIGDVNPGAKVIAGGNIVILGALKGSIIAGSNGNQNAFVMALSMDPIQIQIADILARSPDSRPLRKTKKEAMIATIVEEQICIEAVSKSAIQDINF